jgi:hypothetical protein
MCSAFNLSALSKGYAMPEQDSGHAGIGEALARAYCGAAAHQTYFDGCSIGGRMARMEAASTKQIPTA